MKLPIYQVDAFTDQLFSGNPAAVCPLDEWLPDDMMQAIAAENNLAETAFFVKENDGFRLRWFTPTVEVDLCGHATLATSHVLYDLLEYSQDNIQYITRSGALTVLKNNNGSYTMDFPADILQEKIEEEQADIISRALNISPVTILKGKTDYLVIVSSEKIVKGLQPDFRLLSTVPARGIIVSAKGDEVDFVSRFFGPQTGVDEDPVTGSAHTTLTPYWAIQLHKTSFTAKQLSKRGGSLFCELKGDRVLISGYCKLYLKGEIEV